MSANAAVPAVSVVVPFLNAERFLEEAVASVFSQSFPGWELLLVDDGSTDGSTAAAKALAGRDPDRVRYLEHPGHENRGINAALNLGIRHAKAPFLAFLDSDDVWFPRKLEQQLALMEGHPEVGMVFGRSLYWHGWTGRVEDAMRDTPDRLGVTPGVPIPPPTLLTRILRRESPVPCPSTVLVRRDVLDAVGGLEETVRLDSHADRLFYAKVLLHSPAQASSRCWIRYRQHPASCGSVAKGLGRKRSDRRLYLEWLGRYLEEQGARGSEVWEALQEQLRAIRSGEAKPLRELAKAAARRVLPPRAQDFVRRRLQGAVFRPPAGRVHFGDFRRLRPFSRRWGADRGIPVDRYYIESFLARNAGDIRGRVLEIGDDTYTWRFGGTAVTDNDVLDVREGHPGATIVADLTRAEHVPSNRFDCIVFTETLQLLYETREAVRTLHRILKPGGVLLTTFPGISPIGRPGKWGESWHWSFTTVSAHRLFGELFPPTGLSVAARGNLLAAAAFLYALGAQELTPEELAYEDPAYPVSILVRAVKAGERPQ